MYKTAMPNQRSADQQVVAFALDKALLVALDSARRKNNLDRSTYIRLAMIRELNRHGWNLDEALAFAPTRAGAVISGRVTISSSKEEVAQEMHAHRQKFSSTFVPLGESATAALTKTPLQPGSLLSPATGAPSAPVSRPIPESQKRLTRPPKSPTRIPK